MDFDIRGLALETAQRLVNHHTRVRQAETLAWAPAVSRKAPMLHAWPMQWSTRLA
jgi:hypothetical protein